jgi:hypothetical protein
MPEFASHANMVERISIFAKIKNTNRIFELIVFHP